jgi:hypothetical protein
MPISKFSKSFVIFTFKYANMKRGFVIDAARSEISLWGSVSAAQTVTSAVPLNSKFYFALAMLILRDNLKGFFFL